MSEYWGVLIVGTLKNNFNDQNIGQSELVLSFYTSCPRFVYYRSHTLDTLAPNGSQVLVFTT